MTSVAGHTGFQTPDRTADRVWIIVSLLLAILLGRAVVDEMKIALAAVVLFLAVIVPVLVIGVRIRITVLVLVGILYLAPEIRVAAGLPVIMGDEALLYITALLMMGERLVSRESVRWPPMPPAGWALLMFFPLTLLTMANGAARFGITPIRGDYFEFIKFGKYLLALYIASCVRIDRRFLVTFSWAVTVGAFIAASVAILQSFNAPGVRAVSQAVYFSANPDKMDLYLADRASGTIGNPNELALFVGAGLVFAIALLQLTRNPGHRRLLWLFALTQMVAVLLSGSRSGLLCALLALMLLVMRTNRRVTSVLLVAVTSVIVLFLISAAIGQGQSSLPGFMQPLLERASRFSPAHLADIFARMAMWKAAWSQTQASLLLGYGPAKGASFLMTSQTTDSEIFIVALRYGLVGLVIWVGIWYVFLRTARRAAKAGDRESRVVGRALWSLLVVNLLASGVTYTFLAIRRMTLVCIFVGIAAAIVRTGADKRITEARAGD